LRENKSRRKYLRTVLGFKRPNRHFGKNGKWKLKMENGKWKVENGKFITAFECLGSNLPFSET